MFHQWSLQLPQMINGPQDKHIKLVNIIGNLGAGMLTRAMAKQLSVALAHECLFVDFLSKEELKKVSEVLKHPGWVDAMQVARLELSESFLPLLLMYRCTMPPKRTSTSEAPSMTQDAIRKLVADSVVIALEA
ncbi:hypothetical protein Tco_1360042 [Tanacetum coccineum]